MYDPIVDETIKNHPLRDEFTKDAINEYLKERRAFTKYPLKHYNQLEIKFDPDQLEKLLTRLFIPARGITTTVFGGYTGQFAKCLRAVGHSVIFTDPMQEWVTNAAEDGFEVYKCAAEEIPGKIHARTDLFATFECYMPFSGESASIYTAARFLATKYGILFAESGGTRAVIDEETGMQPAVRLIDSFQPFKKAYSIVHHHREIGELRLHHFRIDENNIETLRLDCKVMYHLYSSIFPDEEEAYITSKSIALLSSRIGVAEDQIYSSLNRIIKLYHDRIFGSSRCYSSTYEFELFSKRFRIMTY